jgi:hypothetical protein
MMQDSLLEIHSGLAAAGFGRLDALADAGFHEKLTLAHIGQQAFLDTFAFEDL